MQLTTCHRRKRCQQAPGGKRDTNARLTGVSCQRGKTQRRNLSDWHSLGIGTRADCLWQHQVAKPSKLSQSNVPEQPTLQCQIT